MLEPDNYILSLYTLYSFNTSSAVINSATGESADSRKRWTSLHAYLSLYLGICIQSVIAGVWACGSSQGEISLCQRDWTTDFFKDRYATTVVFFVHLQKHCQCVWMRRLQTHSFIQQLCSSSARFSQRRRRVGMSGTRLQTVNLLPRCLTLSEAHQQATFVTFYCRYVGHT